MLGLGALLVGLRSQSEERKIICADFIHRLGSRAASPIDEYLIELFRASSARSFATYSSECILFVDDIMALPVAIDPASLASTLPQRTWTTEVQESSVAGVLEMKAGSL